MKNEADPRVLLVRQTRRLGVGLVLLAVLCVYGAWSETSAKVLLRLHGQSAPGRILRYERRALRAFPVVEMHPQDSPALQFHSAESFLPFTAPPPGTPVEVYFDQLPPQATQLRLAHGWAQYEWASTPAMLLFLFLVFLFSGLRLLLVGTHE